MNSLNGYIPPNSQQPLQQAPLSVTSQSPVTPLGIRSLSKVQPVFSTLQMPLKPSQITTNDAVFSSIGPAFGSPSTALSSALSTQHSNAISFPALTPALATVNLPIRDSTWLKLRVCPAFLKEITAKESIPDSEKCQYTGDTCPLAHPPPNVRIENNHVTVCFDFVKVALVIGFRIIIVQCWSNSNPSTVFLLILYILQDLLFILTTFKSIMAE